MSLQNWAAWFAIQRLEIFPVHFAVSGVCSCGKPGCLAKGKHPATPMGVRDATSDIKQVIKWWVDNPDWNIGLHCNKYTVLDVDGEEGKEELRRLVKLHRDVPSFSNGPRATTGGGGYHFYFKSSEVGNKVKFAPGLDIRSEGGYVIAPPSLHASGKRYKWDIGLEVGLVQEMPAWLLKLAKGEPNKFKSYSVPGSDKEKPRVDISSLPAIDDGCRNGELCKIAGRFFWEGNTMPEVVELLDKVNRLKCLPPVSRNEIERIVSNVSRYH